MTLKLLTNKKEEQQPQNISKLQEKIVLKCPVKF